ncbi:MAG: hypothetical protein ACI8TQ_000917 [Planctomycetota bacterium]|jgi:hypothetical protein
MQGSDSIQFNDDDNLQPGSGGLEPNASEGAEVNRPAANANLSENVDAMTEDFEFKEDAHDFLGLEGEVEVMTETSSSNDSETNDGGDLADGWLLEVSPEEDAVATNAIPTAESQVAEDTAEAEQLAEYVNSEIESSGLGEIGTLGEDEVDEDIADDESFADDDDEEFDDELDGEDELEGSNGRGRSLAIAGFCVGILGTVGFLMMDAGVEDAGSSLEVATGENLVEPTLTSTNGNADAAAESIESTTGDAVAAVQVTAADNEPIENVLEGLLAGPSEDLQAVPTEPIVFEPISMELADSDLETTMPALPGMPIVSAEDLELPVQVQPKSTLVQIAEATQSGDIREFREYTTETGSSFIWTGSTVPMESIAREGRILTPAVGVIRATMHSGELFEGRLYAVGSDRVWIEMGPGRVGLDGTKVEKIERITIEDEAAAKEEAGLGQRVRIRTAGGVMYGKVKSRNGKEVTIVTDKGARITLKDPVIESIGRLSGLVLN